MAGFLPNTGGRAQPLGFPPLFGMAFLSILLGFMLMITPSSGQRNWFGPTLGREFHLQTMNYLDVPLWMDRIADSTRAFQIGAHPVLPVQQLWKAPKPWILLSLKGRALQGGLYEYITLAIRPDNKYCIGYFNLRDGRWYAFEGQEKFFPNPIPLGFDSGYPTLVKGYSNLEYLIIGGGAAVDAVSELYWLDPQVTPDDVTKASVAQLIFMFIESHRFFPIRNFVNEHWDVGKEAYIPPTLAEYVVNWSDISCAILHWASTGDWASGGDAKYLARSTSIPVRNEGEALAIIYPILQGKRCRQ